MKIAPLDRAREKGRQARRDGKPIRACKYGDPRARRETVTWSHAFINAWVAGWRETGRVQS